MDHYRKSVMTALLVAAVWAPGWVRADALNSYHIGNSLTWDARVANGLPLLAADAGHTLVTGYHIRCGKPLAYIVANPDDVCVTPSSFGTYVDAFANHAWDVITLQPFPGATARQEYAAAKALIQLARQNPANAGTRFYIYASWDTRPPNGTTFYERWYDPTPVDPDASLTSNASGFDWIYSQLRGDPELRGVELRMIPVGDVLAEVDQRMAAGEVPGFDSGAELYRDDVHLNNLGRFIAANTMLAAVFERDPSGLPVNSDFANSPGQIAPIKITSELARRVQHAVWDVVCTHPYARPLPGDLDWDGFVGIDDLMLVLGNWNLAVPPGDFRADPSDDGFVGIDDVYIVLGNLRRIRRCSCSIR